MQQGYWRGVTDLIVDGTNRSIDTIIVINPEKKQDPE